MKKHLTLLIFLAGPLLECLKVGWLPAPPIVATQGPWSESLSQNIFRNKVWTENFKVHLSSPVELSPLDNHCETCIGSSGCKWRSLQQKDWTYLFCTFCNKRIEHICFAHFAIWESSGDVALTDICFEQLAMREVWWNKRQWHLV